MRRDEWVMRCRGNPLSDCDTVTEWLLCYRGEVTSRLTTSLSVRPSGSGTPVHCLETFNISAHSALDQGTPCMDWTGRQTYITTNHAGPDWRSPFANTQRNTCRPRSNYRLPGFWVQQSFLPGNNITPSFYYIAIHLLAATVSLKLLLKWYKTSSRADSPHTDRLLKSEFHIYVRMNINGASISQTTTRFNHRCLINWSSHHHHHRPHHHHQPHLVKVKVNVDLYSTLSWSHL